MSLKHISFEQHRPPNVQLCLQTHVRIVWQVIYMWVTEHRLVSNKEEGNRRLPEGDWTTRLNVESILPF